MKLRRVIPLVVISAIAGAALLGYGIYKASLEPVTESLEGAELRCVLELGAYRDSPTLLGGYNYVLLEMLSEDFGCRCNIEIPPRGESWLDSLMCGAVDMLIVPANYAFYPDSVFCPTTIDGSSLWLLPKGEYTRLHELDDWIRDYNASFDRLPIRKKFFTNFHDPFNIANLGRRCPNLSPYDSLFRVYAPLPDWDWQLLAAVAFQESKFHLEARSYAGATGLMQLMSGVASYYEVDNIIDPENSIRTGARYLARLQRIFDDYIDDPVELRKFAIAAYHSGEGSLLKCFQLADSLGIECSSWDDMQAVLKMMESDPSIKKDTALPIRMSAGLTMDYVDRVTKLYDAFLKICP